MAHWRHKLKVEHIMSNDALTPDQKGEQMAELLTVKLARYLDISTDDYEDELADIVDAFSGITGYDNTTPQQELDNVMTGLYDWADQEVAPPEGVKARSKMLWIVPPGWKE